MRKVLPLLVLSVLAAPLAARGGEPSYKLKTNSLSDPDPSIAINLRGGAVKPFGDAVEGAPMSDAVNWAFPLQGDLQFRVTKSLQIGGYARYAPAVAADRNKADCKAAGESCGSPSDMGFGGVVEYRFSDRLEGGPWVGASFGYEILRQEVVDEGGRGTYRATGFEGGVQAGMDFELGGVAMGPFLQVGVGEFTKVSRGGESVSLDGKKLHGWAGLGLRIAVLL